VQAIGLRPKLHVSADGSGVVGHAGARLLADLADATGLTAAYSAALRSLRPRGTGHDPGRVATDLAVMLADGGEAIADLAVLRDQAGVFGPVASTSTAWRLLADTDEAALASLRAACGSAREVAWMQAAETGEGIPAARAGGRELPGLVLDLDATLVACHSEKEQAAPTYKGGFGFHPLPCFLANTGEAVSGRLRPGNSGANTAADHIAVLDQALAQIPDAHRHAPTRNRVGHTTVTPQPRLIASTETVRLGSRNWQCDAVDRSVGDAVPGLRFDPRLGECLEPAMHGEDQSAEHLSVGGRI
jgi:thioesterase domain-containing protein